jgi:hypothetical protein
MPVYVCEREEKKVRQSREEPEREGEGGEREST